MFEQAARRKLRFDSSIGPISAEDLWDLDLTSRRGKPNLNDIAITVHGRLEKSTVSFVDDEATADPDMVLRLDILKHVIAVKKTEAKAAADASEKAGKKQQILGILARKADAALESSSEDELRGLLASL